MEYEEELLTEPEEELSPEKKKQGGSMLLIGIQLIVSTLLIAAALVIKLIGGTVHSEIGTWYYKNYNNSIFLNTADSPLPFSDPITLTETSTATPDPSLTKELSPESSVPVKENS